MTPNGATKKIPRVQTLPTCEVTHDFEVEDVICFLYVSDPNFADFYVKNNPKFPNFQPGGRRRLEI